MNEKNTIKELIHAFYEADIAKLFSFTSGHLGALPISDKKLVSLAQSDDLYQMVDAGMLLVSELVKFIIFTIFPIRNIALIIRTLLRRLYCKKIKSAQTMSVISLGNHSYEKDPYFGVLLSNLDEKFNYLKIVGGFNFKSENYEFIESNLSYSNLLKLAMSFFFSPLYVIFYLLNRSRALKENRNAIIFIILGLKEFNSSVFSNNMIILASIRSWLVNNQTKKILYPMEGRNWEKNIIETMNAKSIYSIGYIHCALTPRHFSLTQKGFYRQHDIPSVIVSNSVMSEKLLSETFPEALVRKGFFLRGSKSFNKNVRQDSNTLLFALTGNIKESCEILSRLAEAEIQKTYKVIIRLNPNTSSFRYLIEYAEKHQFTLYTGKENFLPRICFFRSSSVGLDYLKLNVIPVYLDINEVVSNNIFELDNKYTFSSVKLADSIRSAINAIIENQALLVGQDGFKASQYYLDQNFQLNCLKSLVI
jgi:hypothetical protein